MFYYLALPFTSLFDFFDRGGPVIIVLFVLAIVMTTLLIERLLFFISELKNLSDISHKEVSSYKDVNAWILNKIKSKNISVINVAANRNLLLIQGLIALCPLLGLLGHPFQLFLPNISNMELFQVVGRTVNKDRSRLGQCW